MKRIIFTLIVTCALAIPLNAQTPFDSFAPEATRPMLELEESTNITSDSILCAIVADMPNQMLLLVDVSNGQIVSSAPITDDIRKWLSVDPLADKYPGVSPYAYCAWNPVNFVDLWGKDPVSPAPQRVKGTPEYYIYRQNAFQEFNQTKEQQVYYVSYGQKYAQKFRDNSNNFSTNGQKWIREVTLNLQEAMENRLTKQDGTDLEINKEEFLNFAYASHVDAYWNENGTIPFYKLEIKDYISIIKTIENDDLLSARGVQQEAKLGGMLIKHYAKEIINALIDYVQYLKQATSMGKEESLCGY